MGLSRGKILLCGAVLVSLFSSAAAADNASESEGVANKTNATSPGRDEEGVEQVVTDAGGAGDEERDADDEDIFASVLRTKILPPFPLMSVTFGMKLIFTFIIFGFDLAFKPSPPQTSLSPLKNLARDCGSIVFICMALNGYYQDIMKVLHANVTSNFWDFVSVAYLVMLTSPNYVAARAIWGSLMIQSPATTLSLKPKFTAWPCNGVPVVPGSAKYLPFLKNIYALILLPYTAISMAMGTVVSCAYVGWLCSTKCSPLCYLSKAMCSLCCALLGILLTLGLWSWARTSFAYWWQMDWPFIYYFLVQSWATSVSPFLFTLLYACALRTAPQNAFKVLCVLNEDTTFDEEDIKELRALNYEKLKDDFDFDYEELPAVEDEKVLSSKEKFKAARKLLELRPGVIEQRGIESTKEELLAAFQNFDDDKGGYLSAANLRRIMNSLPQDEQPDEGEVDEMIREADIEGGGLINYEEWIDRSLELAASVEKPKPKPNSLDDAKLSLFRHTLKNMSSIISEQILVLFLVREIKTSTWEGYIQALSVTVFERSMSSYCGHLREIASVKIQHMLNMIWNIL